MGKTIVKLIEEQSRKLVEKFDSEIPGTNADAINYTESLIDMYNKEVLGMTHKFESYQSMGQKTRKVLVEYHKSEFAVEYAKEKYLQGIAQIRNREFGISTSITKL